MHIKFLQTSTALACLIGVITSNEVMKFKCLAMWEPLNNQGYSYEEERRHRSFQAAEREERHALAVHEEELKNKRREEERYLKRARLENEYIETKKEIPGWDAIEKTTAGFGYTVLGIPEKINRINDETLEYRLEKLRKFQRLPEEEKKKLIKKAKVVAGSSVEYREKDYERDRLLRTQEVNRIVEQEELRRQNRNCCLGCIEDCSDEYMLCQVITRISCFLTLGFCCTTTCHHLGYNIYCQSGCVCPITADGCKEGCGILGGCCEDFLSSSF